MKIIRLFLVYAIYVELTFVADKVAAPLTLRWCGVYLLLCFPAFILQITAEGK